MNITKDIIYAGVYDKDIDLFEGQYPVKDGITYNSYIIADEKTAVMDGVDGHFTDEWLSGLAEKLGGRSPDYIVVHHMEPDHSASLGAFLKAYPQAKMVASAQAVKLAQNYFKTDLSQRSIAVKDGDVLELGKHVLRFVSAPMVHWPEVMVSYDECDKTLFTADAFGTFGPFEGYEDWSAEASRYYFGIVGKFGVQVQALLKKLSALQVSMILPLHGPVLKEQAAECVKLYSQWSSYAPEEDGAVICYASVYGNTRAAAKELAEKLVQKGQGNVCVFDLARCDQSEAMAAAFRYSKLVLASPTINGNVFPAVKNFITALADHSFQKRFAAFIEAGMWAPASGKLMGDMLAACKDMEFAASKVKITASIDEAGHAAIDALADEIAARK